MNESEVERIREAFAKHGTVISRRVCELIHQQIRAENCDSWDVLPEDEGALWEILWPYLM